MSPFFFGTCVMYIIKLIFMPGMKISKLKARVSVLLRLVNVAHFEISVEKMMGN